MINLPHFMRMSKIVSISVLGLGVGLALSACSAGASSAAGAASAAAPSASALTATAQPTSGPVATSTPAATVAPAAVPTATLVPIQEFPDGTFWSPSENIACEISYHDAGLTRVACQTVTPPRSVTMGVTGTYTTCTGQQCVGSPQYAPTLAYGAATGVGPFRCTSSTAGVTCLADGKGFQISRSGVVPVSG